MSLSNLAFVIAVKNGAETIGACLDSIAPALIQGAKVYIYDSSSTDETRTIIALRCTQARYICEDDGGLYFAWNRAIADVAEPYIFFINCDDVLYSTANLSRILADLQEKCDAVASSGRTVMVREDGAIRYGGSQLTRDWFVGGMPIVTPATIFTVSALRNIGGFDTRYRISADYDLALRLLARYGHRSFLFRPLAILHFSLGGMSNKFRKKAFTEIHHIVIRNLGYIRLCWHLLVCIKIKLKRALLNLYFLARTRA